ncbi:MAG: hypothetical protein ISP90_06620 [Nevskia sp.]|nr:hypothetical protein [Nevskia sp.]
MAETNETKVAEPDPAAALLSMPRRLAIRLLHEAQIAGPQGYEALVLARGAPGRVVPLGTADAGAAEQQLAGLAASGWRPWALFRYRGEPAAAPAADEFAGALFGANPGLLLLTASLAIKGVLQLHAWSPEHGGVAEHTVRIED